MYLNPPCFGQAAKPANPDTLVMPDQDRGAPIQMLEAEYSFSPGTWTIKDYDFTAPDSPTKSSNPTVITQAPLANYEIFEYPGSYADAASGDNIARQRIEQEESQFNRLRGAGNAVAFNPGFTAAIADAVRALLAQLSPAKLQSEAEGGMPLMPGQKKARAFEAYEKLHDNVTRALADDFDSVFGKSFARAYERALRDISAKDTP